MRFITVVRQNLVRRKTRTLLCCGGIAVGVAALVALLGIADGFERSFVEQFAGRGIDLTITEAGVADMLSSNLPDSLTQRVAALPEVEAVAATLYDAISFEKENVLGVPVFGWRPNELMFEQLQLREGRMLDEADEHKILLGNVLADNLKKGLGDSVIVEHEPFEVVGIFESFTIYENGAAVMLLSELQRVMFREGEVTMLAVRLRGEGDREQAARRASAAIENITQEVGRSLGLTALSTRDFASSRLQIRAAHAIAWATSLVAMVVGMLGVLNTMCMSVFERSREFGVLRAIGWRSSRVFRMVLLETLLLTLLGAILGTCLGMGLAWLASRAPVTSGFIRGDVSLGIVIKGWVVTLLVGAAGGLYPAWYATRLAPTDAIRHE